MLRRDLWKRIRFLIRLVLAAVLVVVVLGWGTKGVSAANSRPGDEPYTPTKLEWAALELQAGFGVNTWSSESPVMINWVAEGDGKTILCLLQYTPDTPAKVVKINRDSEQHIFDKYVVSHGWDWLRLRFEERVLPATH